MSIGGQPPSSTHGKSTLARHVRRLSDAISSAGQKGVPNVPTQARVWATVVSVQFAGSGAVTLTLNISGSSTQTAGIAFLGSYPPNVGDSVIAEWWGSDLVVFGALAPYGAQYLTPKAVTTGYTANVGELVECSGGTFAITPPAHPKKGNRFGVKKTDAFSVGYIGISIVADWYLYCKGAGFIFEWDGAAWIVVDTIASLWDSSYVPHLYPDGSGYDYYSIYLNVGYAKFQQTGKTIHYQASFQPIGVPGPGAGFAIATSYPVEPITTGSDRALGAAIYYSNDVNKRFSGACIFAPGYNTGKLYFIEGNANNLLGIDPSFNLTINDTCSFDISYEVA